MAQNITLLGASYADVPSVLLPKTGGGTAQFDDTTISTNAASAGDIASGKLAYVNGVLLTGTGSGGGGGSYPWFGPGTTYVGRIYDHTFNLKNDTTFDSWTASTTAGTIKAATASSSPADFSQTVNYEDTFWFVVRAVADCAYLSGATMKNTVRKISLYFFYCAYPYPSDVTHLNAGTNNAISNINGNRSGVRYYGSTANKLLFGTSAQYGPMYTTAPTYTFDSTNMKMNVRLSAIQAKCNSTYFATSRKAEIDSANTNMVYTVDVYKTPGVNSFMSYYTEQMRTDLTTGL